MPYVDFTTFTEVDTGGYWSQTTTRNTATNLPSGDDSYVYKDYTVGYFTGDYEHWFDTNITAHSTAGNVGFWGVTNNPSAYPVISGQKLMAYAVDDFTLRIYFSDPSTSGDDYSGLAVNTTYFFKVTRISTTATCKIYPTAQDRIDDTNVIVTLTMTGADTTAWRYMMGGFSRNSSGTLLSSHYTENLNLHDTPEAENYDTLNLSDDIELDLSLEKLDLTDTVNLSDNITIAIHQEHYLTDTLSLSDRIEVSDVLSKHLDDSLTLNDNIYLNVPQISKELSDSLTLSDVLSYDLFTVSRTHIDNYFSMLQQLTSDVDNDMRSRALEINDINNDIRFIQSWQSPGDAGFQSLGKEYVKVYINDVEQTTADIDSLTIAQNLNAPHTSSFLLGLPYDSNSKPTIDSTVEIKYHIWSLFKGYITKISPGDTPDNISINCQDEYWKQNRTNKYFKVGHKPQDDLELYYNTIATALSSELSWSPGIGSFVPEFIDVFGMGSSDAISILISQCGNYNWFYHINKNSGVVSKNLQVEGSGDIINIDRQIIGQNIGLYQVLQHRITESIEQIVNKFRVQMGNFTYRIFNSTGGEKKYKAWQIETDLITLRPAWNSFYETQAIASHPVEDNEKYKDVFTKYMFPFIRETWETWADNVSPIIYIAVPFGGEWKLSSGAEEVLDSGFTVDYEHDAVYFDQAIYMYRTDSDTGAMTDIRAPIVQIFIAKKNYYSDTETPATNPETTISNPLMFFTSKMGSYAETIIKNLELSQFSIQSGGWHTTGVDSSGNTSYTYTPSWNDTVFATDYANWELSKNCDKKISGTIDLTIDAMCFYDIDLSNRIMVDGVLDNALNIESIAYNFGNWKANLSLVNGRTYTRTASLPSHGL